jgi:hypothetical protein
LLLLLLYKFKFFCYRHVSHFFNEIELISIEQIYEYIAERDEVVSPTCSAKIEGMFTSKQHGALELTFLRLFYMLSIISYIPGKQSKVYQHQFSYQLTDIFVSSSRFVESKIMKHYVVRLEIIINVAFTMDYFNYLNKLNANLDCRLEREFIIVVLIDLVQ